MFHVKHLLVDTIAAIATPAGVGGIGIIRLSGPASLAIALKVFHPSKATTDFETHRIYHGWIFSRGSKIDEVLLSYMAGPNSYTGEDVVEINCHGGVLADRKTLGLVIEAGARLAERGEFTKRAFLNGRIDLVRAEAVVDLISARSERALSAAAAQLGGRLSERIKEIRGALLNIVSGIEAAIDFPDDIDCPDHGGIWQIVGGLEEQINGLLETAEEGRVVREGIRIAIVGKPNVGKSSLLNRLIEDERMIVSDLPGTTRDTVEENLVIGGLPFVLIDTAGMREPKDSIESAGINRTVREISKADVVMVVLDASNNLSTEDEEVLEAGTKGQAVIVLNKIDLGIRLALNGRAGGARKFLVSALKGVGLKELKEGLEEIVLGRKVCVAEGNGLINARHKQCLWRAKEALKKAKNALDNNSPADLMAIDLRSAITSLGEITGQNVSDEIIEKIFQRFCVGK